MQIIYKTLAPRWNQIIELQETGEPLILHVKDHNAVLPTASIGHCTVKYSMLSPNQPTEKWIPLQGVKSGEIHVKITRKAPSMEKKNTLEADASAHAKGHKISTQVWGSECVLAVSCTATSLGLLFHLFCYYAMNTLCLFSQMRNS
jgi:Ca2+-dependent lipid-binding protein